MVLLSNMYPVRNNDYYHVSLTLSVGCGGWVGGGGVDSCVHVWGVGGGGVDSCVHVWGVGGGGVDSCVHVWGVGRGGVDSCVHVWGVGGPM